jgi:hypothetical protein
LGAHIYVGRDVYSHHGIDCGDWTVIDFGGQGAVKADAIIRRVTLAEFAQGVPIRIRRYGTSYPPEEVVARATSMIGRSGYDLFANNCEHFATWCVTGRHTSAQVEAVWSGVGMVGAVGFGPRIGRSAVVGLGEAAPRSAPNVMSGLARIGGTALGGVTVVAGVGALAGAGTMLFVLRDKPYLTPEERAARRAGRVASIGGAAVGTAAAVHSIGALGVAGYSAAGLSTGLGALGSAAGGGMLTGVAMMGAVPLAAAFAFALLVYCLKRWLEAPAPHSRVRPL